MRACVCVVPLLLLGADMMCICVLGQRDTLVAGPPSSRCEGSCSATASPPKMHHLQDSRLRKTSENRRSTQVRVHMRQHVHVLCSVNVGSVINRQYTEHYFGGN